MRHEVLEGAPECVGVDVRPRVGFVPQHQVLFNAFQLLQASLPVDEVEEAVVRKHLGVVVVDIPPRLFRQLSVTAPVVARLGREQTLEHPEALVRPLAGEQVPMTGHHPDGQLPSATHALDKVVLYFPFRHVLFAFSS